MTMPPELSSGEEIAEVPILQQAPFFGALDASPQ